MNPENVLQEADRLINGEKRDAYGAVRDSFEMIAHGWGPIIGTRVTAEQVALCMIWLKMMREVNRHHRDNIVDIGGYAGLLGKLTEE